MPQEFEFQHLKKKLKQEADWRRFNLISIVIINHNSCHEEVNIKKFPFESVKLHFEHYQAVDYLLKGA